MFLNCQNILTKQFLVFCSLQEKKKVQKKIVAARLLLILNSEKFSGCMRQFITDIQIIKMVKTEIVRSYPHCTERDEILCSFIPCGDGVES